MEQDIRWQQRFSNYKKALNKLMEAVGYATKNADIITDVLSDIVKEGIIQCFEYTHELAWNTMKDYAAYQGNSSIGGSRDATREAFQLKLIEEGYIRNSGNVPTKHQHVNYLRSGISRQHIPNLLWLLRSPQCSRGILKIS